MTGRSFTRPFLGLLLGSTAALIPGASLAQTASAADPGTPVEPEADAAAQDAAAPDNEEIIVTATRREATLNSVPLSIQALTGKTLADQGSYDFNSYSRSVTGLSALDRGPGQQLITIRGISSDTSSTNTDAPESKETTAVYFDETPVSYNGFNPDLQLVDIERVEVLKGPQGTLFGAGALAGVIRIIGRKPNLTEVGGHAEAELSDYTGGGLNYAGNATFNAPLVTDKVGLRVTGYARHEGGFIDNGLDDGIGGTRTKRNVNDGETIGGRGQIRFQPNDLIDVTFKVIHQQTRLDGSQNVDVDQNRGGTENLDIPVGVVLSDREQFRRSDEPYRDRITIYNSDATLHLGAVDLFSSSSLIRRRQNATIDFSNFLPVAFGIGRLSNPAILDNETRARDFVQELRLVSAARDSKFQWVVGAFYSKGRKSFQQDFFSVGVDADNGGAFGSDLLLHTVAGFRDTQYAFFGEASLRFGKLTATAGLRYYNYKSVYDIEGDGAFLGGPLLIEGRETKDDGFNPKINLSYRLTDDKLFYVQAARGFRLGGINDPLLSYCSPDDAAAFSNDYESDSLWNYEAGVKLGWLGGKLQTNVAAYHVDWSNVPITRQLACGVSNTVTAGQLKIDGIEFDATARISPIWRVSGGFSYAHSRITSIDGQASALTGIVKGERAAGVAPWNANLTTSFDVPVADGRRIYGNATWQYVGSIYNYAGTLDPRRVRQQPYSLFSARAGVRLGRYDLSLFVNNLFNKRAVLFHDRILGETRDTLNRPRAIGINLKADF